MLRERIALAFRQQGISAGELLESSQPAGS
jgi:hypothetical protein